MKVLKIVMVAVFLACPASIALPAVPDVPIFEYKGDGQIIFYNTHNGELMEINYKNKKGYIKDGIDDINHILRCRLTGEEMPMDLRLIALVDHIEDRFRSGRIEVISGYRSPGLNGILRANGRGVGKRSYHMQGKAIDIRIRGISSRQLRDYAISLKAGGVGYYPGPDFVHVDVGPVRYW